MFIASNNELQQFVDSLLAEETEKKLLALLRAEDQKQLTYAKNSMIQKMPKELHPHSTNTSSIAYPTSFPSMFQSSNKKTYEYINENLQNMKQISNSYCQPRVDFIPNKTTVLDQIEERVNFEGGIEAEDEAKPNQIINKSQRLKSVNSQMSLSFNQPPRPPKNPFVPNNINFTDKYANSKALEQKYQHLTFTQNSRNIVAMAQTAKYTAFSESVAFPTTVMGGNILPPKENTFNRQSKLDVQDVMRYTLGVKRTSVSKGEAENPFVRAPKKRA